MEYVKRTSLRLRNSDKSALMSNLAVQHLRLAHGRCDVKLDRADRVLKTPGSPVPLGDTTSTPAL